jgi:protein-L-isoaspartate O-methyltransferase
VILAISDAAWGFFGIFVTAAASIIVALIAVLRRQGRMLVSVSEIGRAVNHQGDEAPTLIERVIAVEASQQQSVAHRKWETEAFTILAHHVGCQLPPYPEKEVA